MQPIVCMHKYSKTSPILQARHQLPAGNSRAAWLPKGKLRQSVTRDSICVFVVLTFACRSDKWDKLIHMTPQNIKSAIYAESK